MFHTITMCGCSENRMKIHQTSSIHWSPMYLSPLPKIHKPLMWMRTNCWLSSKGIRVGKKIDNCWKLPKLNERHESTHQRNSTLSWINSEAHLKHIIKLSKEKKRILETAIENYFSHKRRSQHDNQLKPCRNQGFSSETLQARR